MQKNQEDTIAWITVAADAQQPLSVRHQAFGKLVTEFQDMAFGSAYALLGDSASAEDAAQDAFIAAWQNLSQIREARAFPGWLRQIVASQCHRRLRRKQLPTIPLESAVSLKAATADDPQARFLRQAASGALDDALNTLPEIERQVTILFYIADYTQAEIAAFTGLSSVGVRKRLAVARRRLHERMLTDMQEELHHTRPSQDDSFASRVLAFTKLFSALVTKGTSLVRSLQRLSEEETNPLFRAAIEDINRELQGGQCLSYAMAKHPSFFSASYILAIREGEERGVLDVVLERLANGTYVPGTISYFAPDTEKAWENARLLFSLAGHTLMEPEHILLGLLMADESKAIDFLRDSRVNLWKLRWDLQRNLASLPKGQTPGTSPRLQAVNQRMVSEAEHDGTIAIGTLYLLLALVETESTTASRLLRNASVTTEEIRKWITAPAAI